MLIADKVVVEKMPFSDCSDMTGIKPESRDQDQAFKTMEFETKTMMDDDTDHTVMPTNNSKNNYVIRIRTGYGTVKTVP